MVEFQKNETIPMLEKAGAIRRDAWQTAVFGESGIYAFVVPIENFNQYDGDNPPLRALGAEGARAHAEKNRRFIVSSRTYADQTRPDLGYGGQDVRATEARAAVERPDRVRQGDPTTRRWSNRPAPRHTKELVWGMPSVRRCWAATSTSSPR